LRPKKGADGASISAKHSYKATQSKAQQQSITAKHNSKA